MEAAGPSENSQQTDHPTQGNNAQTLKKPSLEQRLPLKPGHLTFILLQYGNLCHLCSDDALYVTL